MLNGNGVKYEFAVRRLFRFLSEAGDGGGFIRKSGETTRVKRIII
jgi:hypothetical protein